MKKILSLTLAMLMMVGTLFSFAACSGGEDDNVLVCGVTVIPDMNEKDEDGNWTGFESEFAMAVAELLDMKVEFQEIDWTQKYSELNSGKIDCIWNGFTANSSDDGIERKDLVDLSYTYMRNQQCIVIKNTNAETIKTEADLVGKTAAVEGGSAGAAYAEDAVGEDGDLAEFPAQINAFLEVDAGRSAFAVVDILLAQKVCGTGDYTDLMIVEDIVLPVEYYAIGFKKGSALTEKVNGAIKTLYENGTLEELAEKYGFENTLEVKID